MKKILYVHRTQGVGAEGAHILGMYEAFRELGNKTRMLCPAGCNPTEKQRTEAAQKDESFVKKIYWLITEHIPQFIFEWIEIGYNGLLLLKRLALHFEFKPDLVYERYALNTFVNVMVSKWLKLPHVLEVNDSVVIERSRPLVFAAFSAYIEKYCLRNVQIVITITEDFKHKLIEKFSLSPHTILVLSNAVSESSFRNIPDCGELAKSMGISRQTVIGSSGQFLPWHGLSEIISRLGPIAEEKNLFFLFIGDGPVKKEILTQASSLGIAERVKFTGMVPIKKVPQYLSLLNFAVIPKAAPHASPMKLMEYMASGLPIVAPDLPSITSVLKDKETARIFRDENFLEMKEFVVELLGDVMQAKQLGDKAREYVFTHLTWSHHAELVMNKLHNE